MGPEACPDEATALTDNVFRHRPCEFPFFVKILLLDSFQLQQSCSGGTHTCPAKALHHRVNPELPTRLPGKQPPWAVSLGSAWNTAFMGACTAWNSTATALSAVRTRTEMVLEYLTAGYILTQSFYFLSLCSSLVLLGSYTSFALRTLHHLDILSSAPSSLLLSF